MNTVTFFVAGVPIPQGSKKGFTRPGSKFVQIVDDNKAVLKPWRQAIERTARLSWLDRPQMLGAVQVNAVFVMPRGKTVTRRFPSVKKADLDKLCRALLDGIGDAETVWKDDSQVIRLVVEKVYGSAPGVHVSVAEVSADVPTRGERLLAEMGTN